MWRWGGDVWRWVCEEVEWVLVLCVSPFQSSLQSSRPGPTMAAGPHSIPHYKQGKVTFFILVHAH